jgi:cell division protein DivIC
MTQPEKKIQSKFPLLKNKFLITGLFFLIWMGFFDPKDWGVIKERMDKLKHLKESELQYQTLIRETSQELSLLKTNAETVEQYAREKFRMKKDNEEVFIVEIP